MWRLPKGGRFCYTLMGAARFIDWARAKECSVKGGRGGSRAAWVVIEVLTTCRYCGRIHPLKYVCGHKPKRFSRRTEEEQGRYTYAFARKSAEIKERSHYLCAVCLDEGRLTCDGLETHHIVKLRDRPDLLLEDSNLICLCADCHRKADAGQIPAERLRELAARRDRGIPPPIPPVEK